MKIVNVAQMVAMEQATDAAGFSYDQMMAEAGAALAESIVEIVSDQDLILFLIGPGNNGGDGLVACRQLQQSGLQAIPYIWKRKSVEDALVEGVIEAVWAEQDPGHEKLKHLAQSAVVFVDALLGTGNTRPIGGSLADLLVVVAKILETRSLTQAARIDPTQPQVVERVQVVACDCPSGLQCDTGEIDPLALQADLTVTFALLKRGHFLQPGAARCGRLIIADINISRELALAEAPEVLTPAEIAALLPKRPADAHKGTFGKALIVAGSANYPGAAALACTSAYRAGAGLVHLASPAVVGRVVASQAPETVHTVLAADLGVLTPVAVPVLTTLLDTHQALLLGPGLGTDKQTVEFVEMLLVGKTKHSRPIGFYSEPETQTTERPSLPPLIIDADGLNAVAQLAEGPRLLPEYSILTPHPGGEMARLTDLSTREVNADRWNVAQRYAAQWNQIVVLKGAYTAIAHPDGRLAISPFAEPALATAGSGDVLAGVLVGLLSQGLDAWDAARAGVYLQALAGRLAARALGPAILASDISAHLPDAMGSLT